MGKQKKLKGKKASSDFSEKLIKAQASKPVPKGKRTIGDVFERRYAETILGSHERWEENKAVFAIGLLYENCQLLKRDFFIEFRGISINHEPLKQEFIPYGELDKHIDKILSWNQKGYHVYFGVNPRSLKGKGKQDDIQDVICFWLDIDAKNFQEGKLEAEKRVLEFQPRPNIIIDSGRGYHCYWVLQEPIINKTEAQGKEIKQILSGLATALGADKQTFNFDRLMRLPATDNIKDTENPQPCFIVQINGEHFYSLSDFNNLLDYHYEEPKGDDLDVSFDGETYIVSDENPIIAQDSIKCTKKQFKNSKLRISDRIKRMILVGELQTEAGADKTRSGRDMAIITALVADGYNYKTIRSVFFNPYLGCSDRIREKGEQTLKYEVAKAYKLVQKERPFVSPQIERIRLIKSIEQKSAEEKLHDIAEYVVEDLDNFCTNYKNDMRLSKWLFDRNQKQLMNIEDMDFLSFLKDRYDLPDKDLKEVLSKIRATIYKKGDEIIPYNFCRYQNESGTLYISNHKNLVFRLDGQKAVHVDNGTDGIVFEFNPNYETINLDLAKIIGANYFAGGFDWQRFKEESLLFKYIIAKANFAREEMHNLTPEDQQYLLTVYFYSLFFEEIQEEKPIICFVGRKASGKSFMATVIGKLLFGRAFLSSPLPDSDRDLKVILATNYFVCFDNLDSKIDSKTLDILAAMATGIGFESRKLYTNHEKLSLRPRVFPLITAREPKFRRDDFVDRLIIFRTEKIPEEKRMGRTGLFNEIMKHREEIWNEIVINLNEIVRLLNERREWMPKCVLRIADWETFARKIHDEAGQEHLRDLLTKMNKEKGKFGIEEDPLFIELKEYIYGQGRIIEEETASEIYRILFEQAERNKNKDFGWRYKNGMAVAKRFANIDEALQDEFDFKWRLDRTKRNVYSISKKGGAADADIIKPVIKGPSVLDQIAGSKQRGG